MHPSADATFPLPLSAYPPGDSGQLLDVLARRIEADPFNAIATLIFLLAVIHTFLAARFTEAAHRIQRRHDAAAGIGHRSTPNLAATALHALGEVEVVFAVWAVPLALVMALSRGWATLATYLTRTVTYTEAMFVVVIMALASTRPIVELAEGVLRRLAHLGGGSPAAWWVSILTVGPLLGSFITEPGAMTISALLLARQFYALLPSARLKYATLGLLFVNVSIGGTLTHFAAPPVLMVARPWGWDTAYMLTHFGWRATLAIVASTLLYYLVFRREFRSMGAWLTTPNPSRADPSSLSALRRAPLWVTASYALLIVWTVVHAHSPAYFLGGFLFFLGFGPATGAFSRMSDFKMPLMVGLFLAGLVVHGGLQGWWIAPLLSRLTETPLFVGATVLTGFNDNALITYLATLVPNLTESLKLAVVAGAVTGGGLTVIANAPNPAGQAVLGGFFGNAVHPLYLFAGALPATLVAALCFRLG
jgi:hypothetical protein